MSSSKLISLSFAGGIVVFAALSVSGADAIPRRKITTRLGTPVHSFRSYSKVNMSALGVAELIAQLNEEDSKFLPSCGESNESGRRRSIWSNAAMIPLWKKLKTIEPQQAALQCDRAFEAMFADYCSAIDCVMESYADRNAPKNQRSLESNLRGLSTAVFLSAHFVEPRRVLSQLDRIDKYAQKIEDTLEHDRTYENVEEQLRAFLRSNLSVESEFRLNVLADVARDDPRVAESKKLELRRMILSLLNSHGVSQEATPDIHEDAIEPAGFDYIWRDELHSDFGRQTEIVKIVERFIRGYYANQDS